MCSRNCRRPPLRALHGLPASAGNRRFRALSQSQFRDPAGDSKPVHRAFSRRRYGDRRPAMPCGRHSRTRPANSACRGKFPRAISSLRAQTLRSGRSFTSRCFGVHGLPTIRTSEPATASNPIRHPKRCLTDRTTRELDNSSTWVSCGYRPDCRSSPCTSLFLIQNP